MQLSSSGLAHAAHPVAPVDLVASSALQALAREVNPRRVRPATHPEREAHRALLPAGGDELPLAVVGAGPARLLCQTEDRRVSWLELAGGHEGS